MKELEQIQLPETVIEQNIPKGIVFIGSQQKIKGLTMWEFDPTDVNNLKLEPAKFTEVKTQLLDKSKASPMSGTIDTKFIIIHKIIFKEGCYYVQALNKKNAYKKILKHSKR